MNFTADKLRKLTIKQLDKVIKAAQAEQSRRKKEEENKQVRKYMFSNPSVRQDGYNTGRYWENSWSPGGPYIYTGSDRMMKKISQAHHITWREGFEEGLATNLKHNPKFAEWRKAFQGLGGYYRYEGVLN